MFVAAGETRVYNVGVYPCRLQTFYELQSFIRHDSTNDIYFNYLNSLLAVRKHTMNVDLNLSVLREKLLVFKSNQVNLTKKVGLVING